MVPDPDVAVDSTGHGVSMAPGSGRTSGLRCLGGDVWPGADMTTDVTAPGGGIAPGMYSRSLGEAAGGLLGAAGGSTLESEWPFPPMS